MLAERLHDHEQGPSIDAASKGVSTRTGALLRQGLDAIHRQTDHLFAGLLAFQWLAAIAVSLAVSPLAWEGGSSRIHAHVWAAVALGAAIVSLPLALAWISPGAARTRHAVAAAQMLMGALFIHLAGGRVETHFHVFGSLAVLAFYRDWTVIVTAALVAAADHVLRGYFWPRSAYGVMAVSPWRVLEHSGWVVLMAYFLIRSCMRSVVEMRAVVEQRAMLEATQAGVEETVRRRTAELNRTAELLKVRDAHLSASAEFSAALNQVEALATFQAALTCLGRTLNIPCSALYTIATDDVTPVARCSYTMDERPLKTAEFLGDGLPLAVSKSGLPFVLRGPFGGDGMTLRGGLIELNLCAIKGWPMMSNDRCVGVLVTAHAVMPTEEQEVFLMASLDQLAVRMNAFGVEEQRMKLLADLRVQSRALEEARRESERASRVKSEFLASMSHELRTPMNSIMGFTARLIRKLAAQLPEREMDALRTVDRNAKHLLVLINDILDLSKIEAGHMELDRAELDLVQAAREAHDQSSALVDGKPIELVFESPARPISLVGDRMKLRQVAMNLISNAIKYTQEGRVTVSVSLAEDDRLGPVARLSVRDTGIGIKPEDHCRLFQNFARLDEGYTRKVGGTGLGLVLSDRYTRMHGGRIDVESVYGAGSEFAVLIPLTASDSGGARPAAAGPATTAGHTDLARQAGGDGVTILCIDDEPDALKYLQLTFQDVGYDAILADGHDAALSQARRKRPDLICLDMSMPGKDGLEVLRSLHADPRLADIPVVVVSANGDPSKALAAGARCYLSKPVDASGLVTTVRDLLGRRMGSALIVEDNPDLAKLMAETLFEAGMQIRIAADGREGLARLAEATPSVIVLDLMMPVMDGFSFLDHLQLDPLWKTIPVVIVTAKELEPQEMLKLGRIGATVMTKGRTDTQRLVEAILGVSAYGTSQATAREAVA
jgi:two-component system sensor histidine kinase/response regulator